MTRFILILLCAVCLPVGMISSQEVSPQAFNVGFAPLSQGFYLGFDHYAGNFSTGLDIGSSFGVLLPPHCYTLALDNNFYFGGRNNFGNKTWHLNTSIVAAKVIYPGSNEPFRLSITPGIGKHFALSYRWSISFGLGIQIPVYTPYPGFQYSNGFTSKNEFKNYQFNGYPGLNLKMELRQR